MGFLLQLFYGVSWSHVIFLIEEKISRVKLIYDFPAKTYYNFI